MKTFKTVDDYINSFPKEIQIILNSIRSAIKESAPNATECISYGMPAYRQGKVLVYFAAQKNHIGFYPTSSGVEKFKKEISNYEFSKGTIRFPIDNEIPLKSIKKIVEYRVKENTAENK